MPLAQVKDEEDNNIEGFDFFWTAENDILLRKFLEFCSKQDVNRKISPWCTA